jgi:putative SOS response-associated peptidase YedK
VEAATVRRCLCHPNLHCRQPHPYWAKDAKIGLSTINAKAETVATAPAFRDAFARRRCLVPADAFYEWQKRDRAHKQPFAIALASREPYGFAGIWERWKDPRNGEWLETFSIITTDPNSLVAPLHNRMPVIIERKDYARWLASDGSAQPPLDLLRPFPAEQMIAWEVGPAVGNVRNDSAELLAADTQQTKQPEELFLPGLLNETDG